MSDSKDHKSQFETVTLAGDLNGTSSFNIELPISFHPRYVYVRDATLVPGAAAMHFTVASNTVGGELFSIGAAANTPVTKSMALCFKVGRSVSNFQFNLVDHNNSPVTGGANSVLYFTLEFVQ